MRTQTHIIDSRAVKAVIAQLPDHWVVRELTERDYGIDLMVEIFAPGLTDANGKEAFAETGAIFHIQIKGVDKQIQSVKTGTINYCISKKSLGYVEKFSIPFFLFRVSVADPQKIYFLWIQRYIKDVMDRENPMWREKNEDSITICIPPENELSNGLKKIEDIAFRPKYLEELMEFSQIYEEIGNRINAIRNGQHEVNEEVIEEIKNRAYRARRFNVLLTHNNCCIDGKSLDALIQYVTELDTVDGRNQPIPDEHNLKMLANSMTGMDIVEEIVLENEGSVAY
nr:DUF4365 domain-containing protein [uncultured Halomonas sp.]